MDIMADFKTTNGRDALRDSKAEADGITQHAQQ